MGSKLPYSEEAEKDESTIEKQRRITTMIIYSSNKRNDETNVIYAKEVKLKNLDDFKMAVSHDYVCAKYKDNHRSSMNFISANVLPFDIDNDYSNNPSDWIHYYIR